MQILRFDDEGVKAPNRKKSSRSLLILGLVGALFGISSAFASSTIQINSGNPVDLGQGVVTVSGCDSNIGFKPETVLTDSATAFRVQDFIIGYDYDGTGKGKVDSEACLGKQIKITLYKDKVGGGVDQVTCASTYNGSADNGKNLKASKLRVGAYGIDIKNDLGYLTPFKCGSDGSVYYEISHFGVRDPFTRSAMDETTYVYWPAQSGFEFNADSFDHITIESVSNETGLSFE